MQFSLASEAALVLGMAAAISATCAYVTKVAREVSKWRQAEQARNAAVDAVVNDWIKRGITPAGAVQEAADYRAQVDVLTAATTDSKRRIDGVEKRLVTVEEQGAKTHTALQHLNDRFDDTDRLLNDAIDEWRNHR